MMSIRGLLPWFVVGALFVVSFVATTAGADVVELSNGRKYEGKVISQDDKYIEFEMELRGRRYSRRFSISVVHAVTRDGRREVITPGTGGGSTPATSSGTGTRPGTTPGTDQRRTKAQVDSLIRQIGTTEPDWWKSTPLDYPRTLDLNWPMPPPRGWNSQRNVGQYVWDVINPNPNRWKSGVRLMHHLLMKHQDSPQRRQRAMRELGRMYHDLSQDYPRAAFWWRQADVENDRYYRGGVHLAECYWKMGSKAMAVELLGRLPAHYSKIKLYADMGETDRAIELTEAYANARGGAADIALLHGGDAYRVVGRYKEAIDCYTRLVRLPPTAEAAKRIQRNKQRARVNIEAIRQFELLDLSRVPDATYRATSQGYAGPVQIEVDVESGRITAVRVTKHQEKQFYSAITDTTRKIVAKQGVKGVDATSSATITSEAIINATGRALADGMQ